MDLGGGGHEYAAGLQVTGSMEKTVDTVIKKLESLVESFERFGK